MAFYDEEWIHDWFDPLNFSGVSGYPSQLHGFAPYKDDWKKCIPKFYVHEDSVEWHFISFMQGISKLNVVIEVVKMKMF